MRTALCSAVALAILAPLSVHAHGQMTEPKPRPVTTKFRADAGALRQAGDSELQWSPLELMRQRVQADQPQAPTFDVMNGCRGMVYETSNPVTELRTGVEFPIKWFIQAPHPGYAEFNIVKPKTDAGGKTKYEKVVTLKRLERFGTDGGNQEATATIPASVTGCEKAGDCALQMYWHSDVASQTYVSCADIAVKGSGAAAGSSGSPSASADDAVDADADAGSPVTVAPGSPADDDEDDNTPASTASTPKPSVTPAPTPTKKTKCRAKTRNLRK